MDKVINFVLFQAGWFACVLLGTTSYHFFGPVIVAGILLIHLYRAADSTREINLLMFALLIGLFWENLLTASGVVFYPQGQYFELLAPLWIIAMWPLLAMTLNVSLSWLKGRFLLSVVFGALGGPAAFLAGERLGAVVFNDTVLAMSVLAVGWSMLFPLLMWLSDRHDNHVITGEKLQREVS